MGPPAVLALIVIGKLPTGVAEDVEIVSVTFTGACTTGETEVGVKLHVAPAGRPVHDKVTVASKGPRAET